jgi:hypothetical protein
MINEIIGILFNMHMLYEMQHYSQICHQTKYTKQFSLICDVIVKNGFYVPKHNFLGNVKKLLVPFSISKLFTFFMHKTFLFGEVKFC